MMRTPRPLLQAKVFCLATALVVVAVGCRTDEALGVRTTVNCPGDNHACLAAQFAAALPAVSDKERDVVLAAEGVVDTEPPLHIGGAAPKLALDGWFGVQPVALAGGKVYVIEMWATWCAPCVQAMPHLSAMAEKYASKGVSVVGVNVEDAEVSEVREFLRKQGRAVRYPNGYARSADTQRQWLLASGIAGLPATFVVDGAGRIAWTGRPDDVEPVVEAIVEGRWSVDLARAEARRRRLAEPAARRAVALLATDSKRAYRLISVLVGRLIQDAPSLLRGLAYHILAGPTVMKRDFDVAYSAAAMAGKSGQWKLPEDLQLMSQIRQAQGRIPEAIALQRRAMQVAGDQAGDYAVRLRELAGLAGQE